MLIVFGLSGREETRETSEGGRREAWKGVYEGSSADEKR